jgi:hypothetical protein
VVSFVFLISRNETGFGCGFEFLVPMKLLNGGDV